MRRVLPWIVAFVLAIAAGGGTVVGLNATVFGPGDFVRVYLDALARGDAESALALPGGRRRQAPTTSCSTTTCSPG